MDFSDGLQSASLPLEFSFGLAGQAMEKHGNLTEYEKEKLLAESSKSVKSKEEMESLKQRISDDSSGMF